MSKQIEDNHIKSSDYIKFRTDASLTKLELQKLNKIIEKKDDDLKV